MAPLIDIRPGRQRVHTVTGWLDSRHSFSFGPHYDPENVGHGLLLVSNDDRVAPGGGFGTHPHRDMEIVTWVLDGALAHRDSTGHEGIIRPGLAQRMSAGRGITHSEMNASGDEPVHFVQMWVPPDTLGIEPSYEQADVSEVLESGGLVAVASGRGHDTGVTICQHDAVLWAARPSTDETVVLPEARHVHVFVARGRAKLGVADLAAGDAARLTDAGSLSITATEPSEVLVWETA